MPDDPPRRGRVISLNHVILVGNLANDPKQNGERTNLTVATNRTWTDRDGNLKEESSFFLCSAWGPLGAAIAKHLEVGSHVLVHGKLHYHKGLDQDGDERAVYSVSVDNCVFLPAHSGKGQALTDQLRKGI